MIQRKIQQGRDAGNSEIGHGGRLPRWHGAPGGRVWGGEMTMGLLFSRVTESKGVRGKGD